MRKKRNKPRNRHGLQALTLCISTAMVLVLLGLVVFSVLLGRNLSSHVKEHLVVTMMLEQDMTDPEARQVCKNLETRPYVNGLEYVSKEQALQAAVKELGSDPSEFVGGNPFTPSIELTMKGDYANNDSLIWIAKELKAFPKVTEISYQKDLTEAVNKKLAQISLILLVLAGLLTFVSFTLINNTVRLGIYARRFSIHTMKLVGASWGFIRRPFLKKAIVIGLVAALLACVVLGCFFYAVYLNEPEIQTVITWKELCITAGAIFLFGLVITVLCSNISVNKFLKMTAGDLYKI